MVDKINSNRCAAISQEKQRLAKLATHYFVLSKSIDRGQELAAARKVKSEKKEAYIEQVKANVAADKARQKAIEARNSSLYTLTVLGDNGNEIAFESIPYNEAIYAPSLGFNVVSCIKETAPITTANATTKPAQKELMVTLYVQDPKTGTTVDIPNVPFSEAMEAGNLGFKVKGMNSSPKPA